jgi:hypothetical protein
MRTTSSSPPRWCRPAGSLGRRRLFLTGVLVFLAAGIVDEHRVADGHPPGLCPDGARTIVVDASGRSGSANHGRYWPMSGRLRIVSHGKPLHTLLC